MKRTDTTVDQAFRYVGGVVSDAHKQLGMKWALGSGILLTITELDPSN